MGGYLRRAEEKDVDLLFAWVNDPVTRKSAFDSHLISYDEHVNWFHKIVGSEKIHQFIYEREGKPVGQVRIEINGDVAELDYSIAPDSRGMGFGRELISLVKKYIGANYEEVKEIIALVKTENIGSQKMLLDNAFSKKYEAYSFTVDR